jgi:hypothetical protein
VSSLRDARLTGDDAIKQPAPGGSGGEVSAKHAGVARDLPWGVRNALYFDGNAITQQAVLSVYVAAAALVTISTYGRLLWRRGQTTPTHQPRGRGPADMNRPRPMPRRRDRADQEPFDSPAGRSDGSAVRRLARLPLLPEFPGSARGTT